MTYAILILPSALKELGRIPQKQRRQIGEKIDRLAEDPFPPTCKKLKGIANTYRIDSGDYRVTVVKVGNRKDVYRNL